MNSVLSPLLRRKAEGDRIPESGCDGMASDGVAGVAKATVPSAEDLLDPPLERAAIAGMGKAPTAPAIKLPNLSLKGFFKVKTAKSDDFSPKARGIWAPFDWISEKLLARETDTAICGGPRAVYGLSVRAVMGANAQMETYNPPHGGEFTQKLGLKWGILRPRLTLHGKFWLRLAPVVDDQPNEYEIRLRSHLPLLPVLPWIILVALPAAIPVAIDQIIGFSWRGPAVAGGWVLLTAVPLIRSYIKTCRNTAEVLNAAIMAGLTPEALVGSQTDRSSIVALVPPRPATAELEDYQPVALKPSVAVTSRMTKVETPEPTKGPERLTEKPAKPRPPSQRPAEAQKMRMTWDAQALVRAKMQADLEAQLEALDQAEIELKAAPKSARPGSQEPVEPTSVSSARVRSRIKKFRTRYDAGTLPDKLAADGAETPETASGNSADRKTRV